MSAEPPTLKVRDTCNEAEGHSDAEGTYTGKATRGYDPSQDIVWLRSEIVSWIEGNLLEKWLASLRLTAHLQGLTSHKGLHQTSPYRPQG